MISEARTYQKKEILKVCPKVYKVLNFTKKGPQLCLGQHYKKMSYLCMVRKDVLTYNLIKR